MTVSPATTVSAALGTATFSEKALPLICWHPRQWHAMVNIGAVSTRNRTCPQRQPPSIGRAGVIIFLWDGSGHPMYAAGPLG
ncbi:hypothetical protein [Sphingomonas sp. Leaf10]|uniref:hypothetical protein n=1 Tax=Sphingomonas sp. Leaf10 TaxID=1735676 RepID=UPI0006F9D74D|nr:hypothetical protein [Sphingomonas sp. Leaf10]KQM36224.1 hypothetical protein ASE59_16425 [Sphingomonas sp. Leaf10]